MNFFKSSLLLKGFPIGKAITKLESLKQLDESGIKKWQEEQRWDIFKHHYHQNTHYRQWIQSIIGKEPENWTDIPILKKTDLQIPLNDRFTKGYTRHNVYLNNTSGSSGNPFYFAKDMFSHAMSWANIFICYSQHDIYYGKSLQARFFGIPLGEWKNRKERVKDLISARVRFPIFDLSDSVLDKYLSLFHRHQFIYVYGYSSSLLLFAKYLVGRKVVLKDLCPTLKVTISTSEVLHDADRILLENGFGVPVVNEYGAAELDLIAFEDRDGNWVINEENLFLEILDDKDNPVNEGADGRIVLTSLFNKAMPFIRYEVGDIGSLETQRKSNRRQLKSLQGRTNDVALLPSGKVSPGLTFYYISKALLEEGGGMKEFIIKQLSIDHFHFEYTSDLPLNELQIKNVMHAMERYLEPGLTATFEKKDHIERTKAGKLRHFQYLVK